MRNQCGFRVENWAFLPFPTAPRKRSLSLSSHRGTIGGIFDPRVLPGLTRHLSLSDTFIEQPERNISLRNRRMRLRVKPAKTQIVSHLRMMYKYAAEKLCKKVAFSLRKPTGLFRKMGTRIFFLKQSLVIRKIRVPLCSKVRNLFVEQSAHSQFPDKTDYQAFTRFFPVEHFAQGSTKCAKKGGFSPFCALLFYIPFC